MKIFLFWLLLYVMPIYCMEKNSNIDTYFEKKRYFSNKALQKKVSKIELMIKNNENLNTRSVPCGQYDHITPIEFAIQNNKMDLLELLLKSGANPNLHHNDTIFETSLNLPLSYAAFLLNVEAVKILLSYKADPNIIVSDDTSLIVVIAELDSKEGVEVVELLLKYGADPNIILNDDITNLKTALTISINRLKKKSELSLKTGEDYKYFKGINNHLNRVIKLLLLYGANPYLRFEESLSNRHKCFSAIDFAKHLEQDEIVKNFEQYPDMRKKTVYILLAKLKPELPNEIIDLIINLVVVEYLEYN